MAEDALDELVAGWTRARGNFEAAALLQGAGIPATAAQRPQERIDKDPNTAAWGLWPTVTHRDMGDVRVDGLPVHFSETDWRIERGGPCLGEHNEEVFGGIAGAEHRRDCVPHGGGRAVTGAMDGVRVVELCDELGMFAGKLLADMGADVVKVEPPGGDRTRTYPPFADDEPGRERSLYFWHYNTSKASVTLDLQADTDRKRLRSLIDRADILLQSGEAGADLDYESLRGVERGADHGHAEPVRAGDAARGRGSDGPHHPGGGRAGLELRV